MGCVIPITNRQTGHSRRLSLERWLCVRGFPLKACSCACWSSSVHDGNAALCLSHSGCGHVSETSFGLGGCGSKGPAVSAVFILPVCRIRRGLALLRRDVSFSGATTTGS